MFSTTYIWQYSAGLRSVATVIAHCRENKPFSNSNQSLVSPMVTRLGPVGFSQRPDPVRTFAGELAEDTFKQAKT
jgi:hypothetical protein